MAEVQDRQALGLAEAAPQDVDNLLQAAAKEILTGHDYLNVVIKPLLQVVNDLPGPCMYITTLVPSSLRLYLTFSHRKWFMLTIGPLQLYKMLDSFEHKSAQAVCTFA